MKIFIFVWLLSLQSFASINPNASKLINQFFPEPVLTDVYFSAFVKNKSKTISEFSGKHTEEIRHIIKSNYTLPLLKEATFTISGNLKDPEIVKTLNFYNTSAGKKAKEILLKKTSKKATELLSKEELAEADSFYRSYAGLMWDAALRQIATKMKDPNSKLAKATKAKLIEYFNSNKISVR